MLNRFRLPRFLIGFIIPALMMLAMAGPAMAQDESGLLIARGVSTAGFLLLLPLGMILFTASTLPGAEESAAQAAITALTVWGIATAAYFVAGFAFEFGGLAVNNPHPDFAGLYWNWSPLIGTMGREWGMLGLRGWALLDKAATPGIYDLFLRHVALLGVVTTIPAFILYRQKTGTWLQLGFGVLAGTLIYPPVGNWVWSAGWLANLGVTQNLGHGFVDAGVATPFVTTGIIGLAILLVFKNFNQLETQDAQLLPVEVPMPPVYLPLLSLLGAGLVLWSWAFIAAGQHIPTASLLGMPRSALNGILAALMAGVTAALYGKLTTNQFNPLMVLRGLLAGLVLVSAAAPFIPPWQAMIAGGIAGILLPLLVYVVDQRLHLNDHTGGVAVFAVMGVLGWLLVGLLADGTAGQGWNTVGADVYLGVTGQGVSGWLVQTGYTVDLPGQLNAQLLGAISVLGWVFLLSFGYFWLAAWMADRRAVVSKEQTSQV